MSKTISISEGSLARQFTADKLRTNLVNGGTCDWVPEEEVQVAPLHITANGTYTPASDGLYGYAPVYVDVPGGSGSSSGGSSSGGGIPGGPGSSIIGTDPTDGNEYIHGVDGNGNITEEKIPSYIAIEAIPNKTDYVNGEAIDYTGIVVNKYDANGDSMGTIPFNELIFPETTATSEDTDSNEYSNGEGVNAVLLQDSLVYDEGEGGAGYRRTEQIGETSEPGSYDDTVYLGTNDGEPFYATVYHNQIFIAVTASGTSIRMIYRIKYQGSFYYYGNFQQYAGLQPYKFKEITNSYADVAIYLPESTVDPTSINADDLQKVQSQIIIPVLWARPGDGRELETAFGIMVTANSGSGSSGSGSGSGSSGESGGNTGGMAGGGGGSW